MELNFFTLLHLCEKSLVLKHMQQNALLANEVLNMT